MMPTFLAVLAAVVLFAFAVSILVDRASGRSPLFNIVLAVMLAGVGAVAFVVLVTMLETQVGW